MVVLFTVLLFLFFIFLFLCFVCAAASKRNGQQDSADQEQEKYIRLHRKG